MRLEELKKRIEAGGEVDLSAFKHILFEDEEEFLAKNSNVYVITDSEIELVSSDRAEIKKACLSYNVFPTRELAERAENLSKLDRLILLWQYKNDCLFIPEWNNLDQPKHSVIYVQMYKDLRVDTIYSVREHKVYFETIEQAEKFISVYDKEIKKIMGVI